VRVVYEKFPVLGELSQPRRKSLLVDFLAETPDDAVLFTDGCLTGKDSLFFGAILEDRNEVDKWLRCQSFPSIYVNSIGPDLVILAPVKSFAN
jgi:hypothetical protein